MIEQTLELLNIFLSKDDGIVVVIEIKDLNFIVEIFYTSKNYLPNQLTILKSSDSINQIFNVYSFNDALSNIAYDADYDDFYIWEPSSIYEGFGLSNYQKKIINTMVVLLNRMNEKADFNLEIQKYVG